MSPRLYARRSARRTLTAAAYAVSALDRAAHAWAASGIGFDACAGGSAGSSTRRTMSPSITSTGDAAAEAASASAAIGAARAVARAGIYGRATVLSGTGELCRIDVVVCP